MATYQEFIDKAIFMSGVQCTDAQAESMVPSVFQQVALNAAADPEKQSLLRRTHTVAMVNGVGTLPDEALTSCKFGASISDPADDSIAQVQSLVLQWPDFVQARTGIQAELAWWTVKGDDQLFYVEPNANYDPSTGFTGDLEITIASVPEIPLTAGTTLDVPSEILSDLLSAMAIALRATVQQAA